MAVGIGVAPKPAGGVGNGPECVSAGPGGVKTPVAELNVPAPDVATLQNEVLLPPWLLAGRLSSVMNTSVVPDSSLRRKACFTPLGQAPLGHVPWKSRLQLAASACRSGLLQLRFARTVSPGVLMPAKRTRRTSRQVVNVYVPPPGKLMVLLSARPVVVSRPPFGSTTPVPAVEPKLPAFATTERPSSAKTKPSAWVRS